MVANKLSIRQIETLRQIHKFVLARGLPPTISDLRKALGVASDQAVIELLVRLERRGLVERTPGKARALNLTNEGRLAIGAPTTQASTRVSVGAGVELSPRQQRIFKRLTDIDPKFARMYMGGLHVLLDQGNPECIVQSAHSIRESTARLSDVGKSLLSQEEIKAAKNERSSNARQLEKLFDPLGGVPWFDQTLYDTWNTEFHQFFIEVSHHGRCPSLDEYRVQLGRYEDFLSSYVLPLQTEIYDRIDKQLATGPEDTALLEFKLLLSRNVESYRYFFRKADARWLEFLRRHTLLTANWEVADYLARIAPQAPEDVMTIIESAPTVQGDSATRKGFIDAANKMPPMIAARLVRKLDDEKWLKGREADWLSHSLNNLLQTLIDNSMHEDALRLSRILLAIQPPTPDSSRATNTHIGAHYYRETLNRFSSIPAAALSQYATLLVSLLGSAISLERPGQTKDGSTMWRPAIEDHKQNWGHGDLKDLLVTAARIALERYFEYVKSAGTRCPATEVENLLNWDLPYSILKRLRLHVYRLHAGDCMPEIEKALIEEFDNWEVWHEYASLLADLFPSLSPDTRRRYFQAVDSGPSGEKEEDYVRHWRARKISVIRHHLSPAELDMYRDLIPEAERMKNPDFLSTHSSMWVGPTSPKTEDDLFGMPVAEVIELLASWTPSKDWFAPSHEGLGRVLSAVVAKSGELYSKEAARFLDPRIRPVYLYHIFYGFREAFKNKARLDWKNTLALAGSIVQGAQTGTLSTFVPGTEDDRFEPEWDAVYQEIGSLLEAGLENTEGPSITSRGEIWPLIEFLCEHPDPTPEHEAQYGGNSMEPATLSINTVRGRAFHTLFAYIFWCDRYLKKNGKKNGHSRIPDEAKRVLESHLDVTRDPSLTIRSVYGQYFPWLFVYDPEWTFGLVARVFPADDPERRYAAWETYQANAVFHEVYTALRAQYELAISELRTFKKERRFWADPVQGLAHHMVIAYAYRMGADKDALWLKFFRVADPKQRGMAVSFCGRAYINREEGRSGDKFPETNRLQELWEWRLADSKDVEELQEFGWWVADGRFNDEWMLERLIETLHKTGGVIEADFLVLAALSALASRHPVPSARALSLIVKSRSADRLMLGHNENIEGILSTLCSSGDVQAIEVAESVIDHLTKLGFERYRSIPEIHRRLPSGFPSS